MKQRLMETAASVVAASSLFLLLFAWFAAIAGTPAVLAITIMTLLIGELLHAYAVEGALIAVTIAILTSLLLLEGSRLFDDLRYVRQHGGAGDAIKSFTGSMWAIGDDDFGVRDPSMIPPFVTLGVLASSTVAMSALGAAMTMTPESLMPTSSALGDVAWHAMHTVPLLEPSSVWGIAEPETAGTPIAYRVSLLLVRLSVAGGFVILGRELIRHWSTASTSRS